MTIEATSDNLTEDRDENVTALNQKQYREISSLKNRLRAAEDGRNLFMTSYAELIDGLISGEVTIPGLQGVTNPSIDLDELEAAHRQITRLTADAAGVQERADELEVKNTTLNSIVSKLSEEAGTLKDALRQLRDQFKEVMAENDRVHGEEIDSLKRIHDNSVESLNSDHQSEVADLRRIHDNTVTQLKGDHEGELQNVKDDAERQRAAKQSEHDQEVSDLKSEHDRILGEANDKAERERLAQEKKYNDLVDAHAREIERLNSEHEAQVNKERAEAQRREDGLREEYRVLEESIPGKLKIAEKNGRDIGLGLAQTLVESANEMGLDKLSSPALSSIRSL